MTATIKQQRFILHLLRQKGFNTRFMDKSFARLGATMRERTGKVTDWVASLDVGRASQVIDQLKKS